MAKGRGRGRRGRARGRAAAPVDLSAADLSAAGGQGLLRVGGGNSTFLPQLFEWLDARHAKRECSWSTPVWFAPVSPNGIGNKVMALVMAFHVALTEKRSLVVSDWPPTTLATTYALDQILRPSSCQKLFDADATKPAVPKCTVRACPFRVKSRFTFSRTQPHWAHQSASFLEVPRAWAHLGWLQWWQGLTQYLFRPGDAMLAGLRRTLGKSELLSAPPAVAATALRRAADAPPVLGSAPDGFAARFAAGVAAWAPTLPRPMIGVHVRKGDGCGDAKRGGCKYVKGFASVVTRLREAGITSGTIYLATDTAEVAEAATKTPTPGFSVLVLREDRKAVSGSHLRGERRREGDDLLHLQLLDLALLSQADVLAGVFASTFVKTALQLGGAQSYVTLDTFPWCPLLRCYWGWRDLCHNCEVCMLQAGGGEACGVGAAQYHTASGLRRALKDDRPARGPFRRYMALVDAATRCVPFASHPLGTSLYDAPVACDYSSRSCAYAPTVPSGSSQVQHSAVGGEACGFRRFAGVDNAAAARLKPSYGYGAAVVPLATPSLDACEAACCEEALCHSVVWDGKGCVASLAIAHGARADDFCWHPTLSAAATTSVRLPGPWELRALAGARAVLDAKQFVRRGPGAGPRVWRKRGNAWSTPVGHAHPLERAIDAVACAADSPMAAPGFRGGGGALEVSDLLIAAIPHGDPRPGKGGGDELTCGAG